MAIPEGREYTPEEFAEIRARLAPKRKVRTRLGIIHNGQVSMEEALIDPSKPRPQAPEPAVSPPPAQTPKATPASKTPANSKPKGEPKEEEPPASGT